MRRHQPDSRRGTAHLALSTMASARLIVAGSFSPPSAYLPFGVVGGESLTVSGRGNDSAPFFFSSSACAPHSARGQHPCPHDARIPSTWRAHGPRTSEHAVRSCVCFLGVSLRIFDSAREMNTCIVLTSRSSIVRDQAACEGRGAGQRAVRQRSERGRPSACSMLGASCAVRGRRRGAPSLRALPDAADGVTQSEAGCR